MKKDINIFEKTKYSKSEEDRVTNGLLAIMTCDNAVVLKLLLERFRIRTPKHFQAIIMDHVRFDRENIIDGQITVGDKIFIGIEVKIDKNQFPLTDQPIRYTQLIRSYELPVKMLLLISPDDTEPFVVKNLNKEYGREVTIRWHSWKTVVNLLNTVVTEYPDARVLGYLHEHFIDYISNLGLLKATTNDKRVSLNLKLKNILGSENIERVLLYLYHYKTSYAREIARGYKVDLYGIQKQLEKLEKGGLIKKTRKGRTLEYSFNEESPYYNPIQEIIKISYQSLTESEINDLFGH